MKLVYIVFKTIGKQMITHVILSYFIETRTLILFL